MSLREISIAVRAENRTMGVFRTISSDVLSLGIAFGALDSQTGRTVMQIFSVVRLMTSLKAILDTTTIAQKVYTAACAFATFVQNALNISYATFLALTGVGIAVIIAAAAAMWYFANSMNAATSSVQNFNEAAAEVPIRTRSIQRAGEVDLYRQGVEGVP
jgi:hypothetical protein